ncbi:glycosyltransferase [bacterium]|nr:glycosyltransferase [candidate division CSSED10-310 bacterium]
MTDIGPDVSIVIPLFNEEASVPELHRRLVETLDATGRSYELVYVDDGSRDRTLDALLHLSDPGGVVRIIKLWSNRGQTAGLAAGFDHSRGAIIISMDGDLQHDPREIPQFLQAIDDGYDIVSGWRENRVDPFFTRKLPSRIANRCMSRMSGIRLHDFGTTFKAYRSEVIRSVVLYGQFHRFIPALVEGMTPKIKEIPIQSLPRVGGKSNYNLTRTFTVFFDLIRIHFLTRWLTRPLQIFGSVGFGLGTLGFAIALYLSILKFSAGISIMAYRAPLFLLSILLMLIGTQFLTLGLLGEIMVKLYHSQPQSRIYTVECELKPGDPLPRSASLNGLTDG